MYDDFPPIYETSVNQNLNYYIILAIIFLIIIILILTLISLARVFKKANRSGISAFIPIYNIIVLLEITNFSRWYLFFLLIPGINIFFYLSLMMSLANYFNKKKAFGFGLTFLPFIYYPILGFGSSEYIGINLVAMEGKTIVSDIPRVLEPEENNPVINEEKDTSSSQINISIGGGVYQKDYTNTLLEVDQNKRILNKDTDLINRSSSILKRPLNNNIDSSKLSFIAPVDEEPVVEEETVDISNNFADRINSIVEKRPVSSEKTFSQSVTIFDSNCNQDGTDTIKQLQSNEVTSAVNQEIQSLKDNQLCENSEFIPCPKCGAKVKSSAKVCFLCGRRLD